MNIRQRLLDSGNFKCACGCGEVLKDAECVIPATAYVLKDHFWNLVPRPAMTQAEEEVEAERTGVHPNPEAERERQGFELSRAVSRRVKLSREEREEFKRWKGEKDEGGEPA